MSEINKEIIMDGITYRLVPICRETEPMYIKITFNDWRLPTIQELLTLVNYSKCNPACDLEDTKPECYWSSTLNISAPNIWYVGFSYGNSGSCSYNCRLLVRCVRDGLDGLEWSASSDIEMTWDEAMEYAKNLVAPVYYKGKQCLK